PPKKPASMPKEGEAMDPPKKPASMPKEGEAMDPPKKLTSMPKEGEAMDPPKKATSMPKEGEAMDLHKKQIALQKEAEADDLGFLYAAISGYPVQILLGRQDKPEENFFFLWTRQAKGYNALHDSHPSPEDRLAFLRTRLDQLTEVILFFRFGLRLAYFGHCEQAIVLFRHFLQVFPSREVFNNLGACHLQRAQKRMEASKAAAALYWFPVLFEPFSRAEILITGHPFRPHDDTSSLLPVLSDHNGHDLEQAVEYLEQAAHADAAYLPARLNLATAYFYGGELLKARGAMKDAMRLAPKNRDVAGWHALLLFLDSQENGLGEAALPPLTRLAHQADSPASLIYNHAILTQPLGKKVKSQWRRLANLPTPLSARYAKQACEVAQVMCATVQSVKEKNFPWPVPVQPGTDLQTVNRDQLFSGWQVSQLGWLQKKQQGTVHRRGEEMEVLDQDGYVTMVVLRGGVLGSTKVVKKKVGNPIHVRPLADGEVWSYGPRWSLLVRDGLVREAWVVGKGP
ncbi:MAG: tetratricopeptide repeat protein, partial [Magnetococcus sp. YQC-5]